MVFVLAAAVQMGSRERLGSIPKVDGSQDSMERMRSTEKKKKVVLNVGVLFDNFCYDFRMILVTFWFLF